MNITKRIATRTGVALATLAIGATIAAGAADAATAGSTGGGSSSVDLRIPKNGDVYFSYTCPMGSHIRGSVGWDTLHNHPSGEWVPDVKDTNGWVGRTDGPHPNTPYTNGADGLYRGFDIELHNYNLVSAETTTVSWSCDAN